MINEKEDTICVYVYNVVVIQQMYDKKKLSNSCSMETYLVLNFHTFISKIHTEQNKE